MSENFGGIAQLVRAIGSYPIGRGFESNFRYHMPCPHGDRPVGQAAKTPPFHGGNTSSILVRVTKSTFLRAFFFLFRFNCLIRIVFIRKSPLLNGPFFSELAKNGKCVILVSHSPDVAQMCDERYELKKIDTKDRSSRRINA